jgi:hypothetical protein
LLTRHAVLDVLCQQNQSGTGSQHWQTSLDSLYQGFAQTKNAGQLVYHAGFPAGDHEAINLGKMFGLSHFDNIRTDFAQHRHMLTHIALER